MKTIFSFSKKILSYFYLVLIIFSILSFSSLVPLVHAVSNSYKVDFDDGTLTYQYYKDWSSLNFTTWSTNSASFVTNAEHYSGAKSYIAYDTSDVYFNFTYSSNYLNEFNTYYNCKYGYEGYAHYWYFYNETGVSLVTIRVQCVTYLIYRLYYYSVTLGWVEFYESGDWVWKFFGFKFNSADNVSYYTTPTSITYGQPAIVCNTPTIKRLKIDGYSLGGNQIYFDDVNATLDSELFGSGAGEGGSGTGAGYNKIGSSSYDSCWRLYTSYSCVSIMENQYDIPMTADFHTYVSYVCYGSGITGEYEIIYQYLQDTMQYIGAYLNGYDLGIPDILEPIGATPTNKFRYIWNFDTISIQNEKIETEVNYAYINEHADPNYPYFKMGFLVGATGEDLDNDGDVCFSYVDICDYEISLNWVDDKFNTCGGNYLICSSVGGSAWEPAYELYYDNLSIVSDELTLENDTLDIYGYIGNNHPLTGLPYYKINTTVTIGYILSTMVDITYLKVYYNDGATDTEVGQEQGFPITLFSSSRTYGFIPQTTGYYNVSLYRLGARILNESFYVIDNIDSYYIYSYPNPSDGLNPYTVGYYFHNPSGLDGFIAVFDEPSKINAYSNNFYSFYIEANSSGTFTFYPSYFGTQYFQLFANRSGVYLTVGSMHPHISLNQFLTGGKIFILKENIAINVNEFYDPINQPYILETQYQTISGYHTYINAFTVIKINGAIRFDVSKTQVFNMTYIPTIKGLNIATLEIYINNSWITLDTGYYNVTTGIEAFGEPPSLFPKLSPEFGAIVSTIIITSFLLLPLLISLSFKKSPTISPVVYMVSGGIGISICVVFGLIPIWIPFFLVVIGIIITALIYLRKE